MDAVLEKMRMPRTTTTAVVIADPTPSCVPRQTRNDDVPKEGRDEDAVRETPFQPGATGAKEGIESSDDGDRQERGEPDGNSRVEQDSQHDSDDQSDDSNHEVPPWFVSTAGVAYSGAESVSASIDNEGETFVETVMPVID